MTHKQQIDQKLAQIRELIKECEKLADEGNIEFSILIRGFVKS